MVVAVIFRRRRAFLTSLAVVILMGTWLHLLLDAIFVGVRLFVPLSDEYFRFRGPISWRYDNWVVNYILHPVFLIEIYVFVLAAAVFQAKRSNSGGILISSTLLNRNRKLLAISGLVTLAYAVNWFLIYPITVVE
jgi:hypothetical protein